MPRLDGISRRLRRLRQVLVLLVLEVAACQRVTPVSSPPPPNAEHSIDGVPACQSHGRARSARDVTLEAAAMILEKSKRLASEDGLEQWETPRGTYWVVKGNFDDMAHVLGEQEAEIYGDKARGVHAGDIVLDGGAHFGGFVRLALGRGAKKVVAIDIAPETLECLRRNFQVEIAAGKVIVYGKGIWHKEESASLARGLSAWSDQVAPVGKDLVQLTTIDRIVAELGLARVDFIKMDIEGSEKNALIGAMQTLRKFRPRMALASYHKPHDALTLSTISREFLPDYRVCVSGVSLGWGYQTLFLE